MSHKTDVACKRKRVNDRRRGGKIAQLYKDRCEAVLPYHQWKQALKELYYIMGC